MSLIFVSTHMHQKDQDVFENGSEWVRVDFHLHTKADKEFKFSGSEKEFYKQYAQKLADEGIGLGVITNHNKFDLKEFKELRKEARKLGVVLLPGLELSVGDGSNGIHCLVVFSDEWISSKGDLINPFLTAAFAGKSPTQYETENGRTEDGLHATLKLLERTNGDYFVVFAHVEQRSGLWAEVGGGRITELSELPLVQERCLGFQKVRTHQKTGKGCRVSVQGWWKGRYPAEVEGSDAKSIDQIGKGTKQSFVKMGAGTFEALKFALTDPKHRVRFDAPNNEHSWIKSIRFQGGLFDGLAVSFSPNLNCLIGIRGSGKSAVLECLRYVLDISPGDTPEDANYKKELVPYVLQSGGTATVEVCDIHGTTYEVSRTLRYDPVVKLNGITQSDVAIDSSLLRSPLYFGQKDLAASGDGFGTDLVEKLVGPDLETLRAKTATIAVKVTEKVADVEKTVEAATKLADLQKQFNDLSFQLGRFKKHGLEKKLADQHRSQEQGEYIQSALGIGEDVRDQVNELLDTFSEDKLFGEEVSDQGHKSTFAKLKAQQKVIEKQIGAISAAGEKISSAVANIETISEGFDDAVKKKEDAFSKTKRAINEELKAKGIATVDLDEFLDTSNKVQKTKKAIEAVAKTAARHTAELSVLDGLLTELQEAWLAEHQETTRLLKVINDSQDALSVVPEFKANKTAFADHAKALLGGKGLTTKSFEALADEYEDFVQVFRALDKASALFGTKAEVFKELFTENLSEMLTFTVPNQYEIKYHGKPLGSHSLGQRASAMILFVLAQLEKDVLIIDQPEDDLDNQTVYEDVVKLIQRQKPNKQFLLATHNANFPVLGDAEMIVSCSQEGTDFDIQCEGIDAEDCQKKIVKIMEGGPEAFARRRAIYQLWRG